jgi:hypothetical protein
MGCRWASGSVMGGRRQPAQPLIAAGLLALPTAAAAAETWHEEPAVATLFQQAGVVGPFVLLNEIRVELPCCNPFSAEQRFSPASTFKIPNSLIGLSLGAVSGVDERIPCTGGPNPLMREWLEPMALRRMDEAVHHLGYGNEQIGSDGTTFWLRGPLAISAVEQTRFPSRLAHQNLPFPRTAQQQVVEIPGGCRTALEPPCQDRLAELPRRRRGLVGGLGAAGSRQPAGPRGAAAPRRPHGHHPRTGKAAGATLRDRSAGDRVSLPTMVSPGQGAPVVLPVHPCTSAASNRTCRTWCIASTTSFCRGCASTALIPTTRCGC